MKKIITYAALLLVMFCSIQCNDKLKDDVLAVYDKQPIGIFLESQENLTEWVKLLKYTGKYNALNVKDKYTCFVPTNQAVGEYLQAKGYASVESIPMDIAQYIVQYSIISSAQPYISTAFSNGKLQDSTASGDYLVTKFRAGGINAIYINDYARIISKDIEVTNGVLHIIDKVLDPILRTVRDIVADDKSYSVFYEALTLTGLDVPLVSIRGDGQKSYYTVLVVSDETFAAAGIQDLQGLITKLGAGGEGYTQPGNALYRYVAYHLVKSNAAVSDLADLPDQAATKNVSTLAENELFSVSDIAGVVYLNKDNEDKYTTRFREGFTDMQARNGFVHEVDRVMEVYSPAPSVVLFEFSEYAEFKAIPFYRDYSKGRQIQEFSRETAPKEIRWMTIPDGNVYLAYETRNTWTSTRNRDAIDIGVGAVGWIEFDLPVIVKGKYKVSLGKGNYGTRGTFQPILDGVRLGGALNFSGGNGDKVEMGKVSLKTTSKHTIRFSVVKEGNGEVDYILFEPEK